MNKISESVGESFDSLLRQSPHNRPAPLKSLEGMYSDSEAWKSHKKEKETIVLP
ncbi:hypothetical protein F2Q68_00036800 [Brassica cretica]|uniref:Uncharacterized protein n=2 Tax=Brassica cretica TaxID=69181 RepID=A0ABQ7E071_BRACR|nr:hypothetical protein F2Q68_00036800 [Brassica cretica]KAF3590673.1 hypothetical protein DY000_02026150 [Brassica cretica]